MEPNSTFSDSDWILIIELLQREQKQLLLEIRHTDAANFREQLRKRLTDVETLLSRIPQLTY